VPPRGVRVFGMDGVSYASKSVRMGHSLILRTPSKVLNFVRIVVSISLKLVPFMRSTMSYLPRV